MAPRMSPLRPEFQARRSPMTSPVFTSRPSGDTLHSRHVIAAMGISAALVIILMRRAGLSLSILSVGGIAIAAALAMLLAIAAILRDAPSRRGQIGRDIALWFAA